jgi:hypothetical protein
MAFADRIRTAGTLEYAIYDDLLLTVTGTTATQVASTRLAPLGMHERSHLQEWILANPDVIGPGVKIVASEFGDWQTAAGDPVKDRLDILALDPDGGRLVVVELKIDAAPHSVYMQAINYAAMASRLSKEDVADLYAKTHQKSDPGSTAPTTLEELSVDGLLTDEGIANPRIVLIAASFPASVTSAAVWLAKQGVKISLIRFSAYQVQGQTVVHFRTLFPVQDVDEFTIGRRSLEASSPQRSVADGPPWDEAALRRLADQGNPATITLMNLCAAEEGGYVGVPEIASEAHVSVGSVRGQLAGLTMRLKNPKYGFAQTTSPVDVTWLSGGTASYSLPTHLAETWRRIQGELTQDELLPPEQGQTAG